MSHRINIRDKLVESMKDELSAANSNIYFTDIDRQVFGDQLFLSQIDVFPAITISVGPERPTYQPGGFRWLNADYYIRIYVRSEDGSAEQLEKIIEDIKTFIDLHEDFEYDIRKPGMKPEDPSEKGQVTQFTLLEITTDEGVLKPYGVAEMLVSILYGERNARFRT